VLEALHGVDGLQIHQGLSLSNRNTALYLAVLG
jgi:hypothetical protein